MEEALFIGGLVTLNIIFGVAWWNARKELRLRRELGLELSARPTPRPMPTTSTTTSDNQRLELAVEAIALEVERLAEGQRFVAKVLSERSSADRGRDRLPASPHVITPH
jgi:hypothetical protein